MKRYCLFLTIILTILTSAKLKAQEGITSKSVAGDLVLEIPKADLIKILPPLKVKLKEIKELSFEGFCDSRKLLFLHTNGDALNAVLAVMKDMNLIYYIKQNTSIENAKKACLNEDEIKSSFNNE